MAQFAPRRTASVSCPDCALLKIRLAYRSVAAAGPNDAVGISADPLIAELLRSILLKPGLGFLALPSKSGIADEIRQAEIS
jgi:hypothetical protein